jgi:3-hydroxyacyl-[acyl-carrier-protein] dehydratase
METALVLSIDSHLVWRLMPHRGHMLLLDRAAYYPAERLLVGIKNVAQNDPVVQGHFPDHPIFPGSLLIEALAQASGLLMNIEYLRDKAGLDVARLAAPEFRDAPLTVPMTVLVDSKIRQLGTVLPGDQVELRSRLVLQHGKMGHFEVSGGVGGRDVACGEVMLAYPPYLS